MSYWLAITREYTGVAEAPTTDGGIALHELPSSPAARPVVATEAEHQGYKNHSPYARLGWSRVAWDDQRGLWLGCLTLCDFGRIVESDIILIQSELSSPSDAALT